MVIRNINVQQHHVKTLCDSSLHLATEFCSKWRASQNLLDRFLQELTHGASGKFCSNKWCESLGDRNLRTLTRWPSNSDDKRSAVMFTRIVPWFDPSFFCASESWSHWQRQIQYNVFHKFNGTFQCFSRSQHQKRRRASTFQDLGTPWKFNSSPLKIYLPNRTGSSSNHHFSGASC